MIFNPRNLKDPLWVTLNKHERHMVLALCVYARQDTGRCLCFPSFTKLQVDTCMKRQTVSSVLLSLEEKQAIRIYRKPGKSNYYDLTYWRHSDKKPVASRKFQLILADRLHQDGKNTSDPNDTSRDD
jgi:hypothetical protein